MAHALLWTHSMKPHWVAPLLVLLLARSAHATEPWVEASEESSVVEVNVESPTVQARHWYGWQTALVDAASLGLGVGMNALSGDGNAGNGVRAFAVGLTVTGYALGGPVVHAAHGQWGKAAASLGLRLGAPAAGTLAGLAIGSAACPHDDSDVPCYAVGGGLGLLAGLATAIIVDSAVLAYEPEREPAAAQGIRLAPVVIAEHDRWGAGIGGTF